MKIKLTPEKETLKTNIIERTIGRAVSVEPYTQPFGPASRDLLGDVFHALYNQDIQPLEDKDVPPDRTINHALMKWMKRDEEFMQARMKTTGKLAHSLISSKLLYEYLITDDAIRRALEVQEEPPPQEGGSGDQSENNPQNGSGRGSGSRDEDLKDAVKKLEGLSKNVIGSKIMSVGAKKAEGQSDKVDAVMNSWGINPGDITVNNIDEIMKIVDGNDGKMKEISDLAGRFESVAASALERVREAYVGQIVDTKRTQDFQTMYGTEMFYLLSPNVPPLIHAKYVTDYLESGLLGVEMRAEGKEFGSLYIMVDGSGSMEGELEVHAKAVALGLAKALNRDSLNNREYTLTTFGSTNDRFFTVKSTEGWNEHFTWATLQQNGGTDFDTAFMKAIKDIKDMPEGTDLVFITDGSCNLSPNVIGRWKEFKEQTGTRLLYVDVSGYENHVLKELADLYLRVDINNGDMNIFADGIASKLAENMESSRLNRMNVESDT
jgi:uncharacterized protein with von Willebrand factor type A (vWA) domain